MALTQRQVKRVPATGHVSHEAQRRIDKRVESILRRQGFGHAQAQGKAVAAVTQRRTGDGSQA
jgi:hypothetical protein